MQNYGLFLDKSNNYCDFFKFVRILWLKSFRYILVYVRAPVRGKTICQTLQKHAPQYRKTCSVASENTLHLPPKHALFLRDGACFWVPRHIFSDATEHVFRWYSVNCLHQAGQDRLSLRKFLKEGFWCVRKKRPLSLYVTFKHQIILVSWRFIWKSALLGRRESIAFIAKKFTRCGYYSTSALLYRRGSSIFEWLEVCGGF